MPTTTLSLSGLLKLSNSGKIMPDCRIELWDKKTDGYGWLCSSQTNIDGDFQFILVDPIAAKIVAGDILLSYRVYKENQRLVEGDVKNYTLPIVIEMTDDTLDNIIVDDLKEPNQIPYINISGTVIDSTKKALTDPVKVNIYEKGFRQKFLLGSTILNRGRYSIKINTKNVTNSTVLDKRYLFIEVADTSDDTVIGKSIDISLNNSDVVIDIICKAQSSQSRYDWLLESIEMITGKIDLSTLTINEDRNDEVSYVARAVGEGRDIILAIVYSHREANLTGLDPMLYFALAISGLNDVAILNNLGASRVIEAINTAIDLNDINAIDQTEIDAFTAGYLGQRINTALDMYIKGEDFHLGDVLVAIFGDNTIVNNFMTLYSQKFDTRENFWNEYQTLYGATLAGLGKLGLQLAAITSFQPAIIAAIIVELDNNNITTLATWDIDTWKNLVSDVCANENKLYVPANIRGEETDPGNLYVQGLYADRLMGICQSLYPMGYILGQLQGDAGVLLIPDDTIRTEVIAFIERYPDFDPRVDNVNNINATDYDLTGITDDPAQLRDGLAPFQRILRVVGGNPVACCTLIIEGVNSAYAVSNMAFEVFTETYGYLFPAIKEAKPQSTNHTISVTTENLTQGTDYIRGLAPVVEIVYNTAATIAAVTKDSLVNAVIAATGSSSLPPENLIIQENTMVASLSSFSSTSPTAFAIPVIPPVFPGGYIPDPNDIPQLSSLFQGLDYCTCSACTSLYSPAAYLADTLNFLKRNSTVASPYYDALKAKRPDLVNIDLTCKNSHTEMPYIDLAIELLEIQVLRATSSSYLPSGYTNFSFQTRGTEAQLAAYPEHMYKLIPVPTPPPTDYLDYTAFTVGAITPYDEIYNSTNLAGAVYPYNLPYNLPMEESRVYLNHFGIKRLEMMKLFLPFNQVPVVGPTLPPTNKITNFALYAEWLGLSQFAAIIVTGAYSYVTTNPYAFYGAAAVTLTPSNGFIDPLNNTLRVPATGTGTNWINVICSRIDVLIQQANVSYNELLQYLTTSYINPFVPALGSRQAVIVTNSTSVSADTCLLDKLKLVFTDNIPNPVGSAFSAAFFNKLHRFIRMRANNKFSIYQWDILFRAMNITSVNNDNFQQIGKLLFLADRLNLSPEIISMWFNQADQVHYINYPEGSIETLPSVYDTIFSNKGVVNNASTNYFLSPSSLPPAYNGYTGQIANFMGITEDEVISLLNFIEIPLTDPVTVGILSRLYVIAQITKSKQISVADFIIVTKLCTPPTPPTPPISPLPIAVIIPYDLNSWVAAGGSLNDYINNLQYLLDTIDAVQDSQFSPSELQYIVADIDTNGIAASKNEIQQFYESIRSELQKNPLFPSVDIPNDVLLDKLKGIIFQHFAKEFSISLQLVNDIFSSADDISLPTGNKFVKYILDNNYVRSTYRLSEENFIFIDVLDSDGTVTVPIPIPPSASGSTDISPSFKLMLLYNWYKYFYKVTFVSNRLKLKTAEFEYLYLPQPTTTTGFDFTQIPVTMLTTLPPSLGRFDDSPVTVTFQDALLGVLRLSRLIDISNKMSFDEHGIGKLLDAVSGIIRPSSPADSVIVVGPTDYTEINICFTNLLSLINKDSWGDMLYELIGNYVPVSGYTQYVSATTVDGLLDTNFTMTGSTNYSGLIYENLNHFLNISDLLYWAQKIGLTPTTLHAQLIEDINLEDSRNLIIAAKGKYTDETWAEIARPLRDQIRIKQRDALVSYVKLTYNDLFQDLLIDFGMDPCMNTSRVKQAINSVQLFIDRMLMGLEYYGGNRLTLSDTMIPQWQTWRKWYSVWQANRKIFFYPEDWMEPELRDDKTPFFVDMEDRLKQDDVTIDKVQGAMLEYLDKLDNVSRLEPVGSCDDSVMNRTHVFARTKGKSQKYFHRILRNSKVENTWGPWEPLDIDIPSDHIVPYIWRNRLYIFWLTFQVKYIPVPKSIANARETGVLVMSAPQNLKNHQYFYNTQDEVVTENTGGGLAGTPETKDYYYPRIEITLNWSEFKENTWQKPALSKDPMVLKISPWLQEQMYYYLYHYQSPLVGYTPPAVGANPFSSPDVTFRGEEALLFEYLMNNRTEDFTDFIKSRINITPYVGYKKNIRQQTPANYIDFIGTMVPGDLYLLVNYPGYFSVWTPNAAWLKDETRNIRSFHFNGENAVDVPNDLLFKYQNTPPETMYHKNGAMISYPNAKYTSAAKFPGYLSVTYPSSGFYTYFNESGITVYPKTMGDNFSILDQIIQPNYRIFPGAGYNISPVENKFMFEDVVNTYFVRYLDELPATNPYYLMDIDSSAVAAGSFYKLAVAASGPVMLKTASLPSEDNNNVGEIPLKGIYPSAVKSGAQMGMPKQIYDPSGAQSWEGVITTRVLTEDNESFVEYSSSIGVGSSTMAIGAKIVPYSGFKGHYLFQTLYHPHIKDFKRVLNQYGIEGLMRPDNIGVNPWPIVQTFPNNMNFVGRYLPTPAVMTPYPQDIVDFSPEGLYSQYNWELFYHLPMLMAQRMSENQKFYDAQKWYHFIFDPTSNTNMDNSTVITGTTKKYWKFLPFFNYVPSAGSFTTLADLLDAIHAGSGSALTQVSQSEGNPFQPFAIARMRTVSFMKNTVMKYLDNLIAWGDNLFMQDTIESINEATNLYILAANILGKRPTSVPPRVKANSYSFAQLAALPLPGIDTIGEATVPIETYIDPGPVGVPGPIGATTGITTDYFCLPPNDKLLTYWDTVEDRLFKIRHCQNIDGVKQQLPLFDPPIDPALLVRAAALGVDIDSVLNDISGVNLPNYRFTYMIQKANEFCNDVKSLGNALLSALEKKDAEQLALLRSGQEINVQKAILTIKQLQINEASTNIEVIDAQIAIAQAKYNYYSSRTFINFSEQNALDMQSGSADLQSTASVLQGIGSMLALIPNFSLQMWAAVGPTFGGSNLASMMQAAAGIVSTQASIMGIAASMAATKGGYQRRMDDWRFQAESAQLEISQLNKQRVAAEIRLQMAEKDLDNQKQLIENADAVDAFMRTKYTNVKLYDWMKKQISITYFQAYQLAYNMAKKAQQCYTNELPLSKLMTDGGFIQPTSWDSLKNGLLSGDMLQYDIRNMENAYITDNARTLELTKHISVAMLNPSQLIRLKATGTCDIEIPEILYDMDFPGHINRTIKSVSISIPCVAGPYTTIPCTLSHSGSYIRRNTTDDPIYVSASGIPCGAIATSSAQNDNGMFEFNFRDERYLPFEGAGAISSWNISLVNNTSPIDMRIFPFDFNTISDVILHVKYTAINVTGEYADNVAGQVSENIMNAIIGNYPPEAPASTVDLPRYFSLKHEYSNEWFKFVNDIATGVPSPTLKIPISLDRFPFFAQGREVVVSKLGFAKRLKTGHLYSFKIATDGYPDTTIDTICTMVDLSPTLPTINESTPYDMTITITPNVPSTLDGFDVNMDDIYMVAVYSVNL